MKGAFSSPEQVLFRKIQQSLYPDTPYAYESGGDPDYIPDLTQEDLQSSTGNTIILPTAIYIFTATGT